MGQIYFRQSIFSCLTRALWRGFVAGVPTLQDLQNRVNIANAALSNALRSAFPAGTRIKWMRRHGQIKPSEAVVHSVSGHDVFVRYETTDRYRGKVTRFKHVHWSRITIAADAKR